MWQSCFPSSFCAERKQFLRDYRGLLRSDIELCQVVTGADAFHGRWFSLYLTSSHTQNYSCPISPPLPNFSNCPFILLLAHIRL